MCDLSLGKISILIIIIIIVIIIIIIILVVITFAKLVRSEVFLEYRFTSKP